MKKYIKFLFIACLWASFSTSCYDDKSTERSTTLEDIVIDTTGLGMDLNVKFNHELKVNPKIYVGDEGNTSSLSYKWELSMEAGTDPDNFSEIGTEATLSKTIVNLPSVNPYILVLTVTNRNTELQKQVTWNVYVNNSLGEGLVVADTKDGGLTSDLSWVHCREVAEIYDGEDAVSRNLYSSVNGSNIEGKVTSMCYTSVLLISTRSYENRLYVGTDKDLFSVDPLTYKAVYSSNELFFAAPNNCSPSFLSLIHI